jgi:ATP-binding cassette subfamily A (ABC1) protein 3
VQVTFDHSLSSEKTSAAAEELLLRIRSVAPDTHPSLAAHHASYHLKAKDTAIVEQVLTVLDSERSRLGIASCDVHGSTIEDIFLDLMTRPDDPQAEIHSSPNFVSAPQAPAALEMDDGRAMNSWQQAWTIFYKRALVFRRSWLAFLLLLSITISASCIPLTFMSKRSKSCVKTVLQTIYFPLYLPDFVPYPGFTYNATDLIASPPGIISTLGNTTNSIPVTYVPDNATFVSTIDAMYRNMSLGGVSLDLQTGGSLVAWETNPPGLTGAAMLNLATNILFNRALNATGGNATLIEAQYSPFPPVIAGTFLALKWLIFFGAGMVSYGIARHTP